MSSTLTRSERAVQAKLQDGKQLTSDDRAVIQARMARAGMSRSERSGAMSAIQARQFPSGSTVRLLNPQGNPRAVIGKVEQLAYQCDGGRGAQPDWQARLAGLSNALGPAGPHDFSFNFTETQGGVDMDWSGSVRIEIDEPVPVSAAQSTTVNAGGSASGADQVSNQTQIGQTSSGSANGGYNPGNSGGATGSVGVQGGSSSTQTNGRQQSGTTGDTSSGELRTRDQQMRANMIAYCSVQCSVNFGWTDVINPFMWGIHAADQFTNNGRQSGSVRCGTVTWTQNQGI